jgi:hypothetical protein
MAFFTLWGMPLMFFIAGMAVWYSLRKRTAGEYLRERARRLLVPFIVELVALRKEGHNANGRITCKSEGIAARCYCYI